MYSWRMFALVLGCCVSYSQSASETLMQFGSNGIAPTFQPSAFTVLDKDGDSVKPAVETLSGFVLVRIDTMPRFDDPVADQKKENNWVFFPHISNPADNEMLHLEFTFNHNARCPSYTHAGTVQCREYVTVYVVEMSASEDVNTYDVVGNALKAVNLTSNGQISQDLTFEQYINFPASTTGYRIVIHDEGSHFVIKNLQLRRFYCEYTIDPNHLPLECNDTPATDAKNTTVTCMCTGAHSVYPPEGDITKNCYLDKRGPYALFSNVATNQRCTCDTGYEYTIVNNNRVCLALPSTTSTPVPSPTPTPTTVTTSTQSTSKSSSTLITSPTSATTTVSPPTTTNPASSSTPASTPQNSTKPSTIGDNTTTGCGASAIGVSRMTAVVLTLVVMLVRCD